jgi:REP element-mobilizing transposase RayT
MPVIGFHVIVTAYGFWLPNDPRGSWSDFVGAWELLRFGRATKVTTHRSLASVPHDREQRLAAKRALKYPPVRFTPEQIKSIAKGFARAAKESGYVVYACAILHDHAHLVIGRHERTVEQLTAHLKAFATRQLRADNVHPFEPHAREDGSVTSVWAEGLWKVFLFTEAEMRRAIKYVQDNPPKEGMPEQEWGFVTRYEGESNVPRRG